MKSVMDNGFGGKGYEPPKKMIKPPRPPKNLSARLSKALEVLKIKVMASNEAIKIEGTIPIVSTPSV